MISIEQVIANNYTDRPLWCVYGPSCFPTLFCCKIKLQDIDISEFDYCIWGYSVYKRKPGFRTLGRAVKPWAKQNDAKFFLDQEDALAFLQKISTPKL